MELQNDSSSRPQTGDSSAFSRTCFLSCLRSLLAPASLSSLPHPQLSHYASIACLLPLLASTLELAPNNPVSMAVTPYTSFMDGQYLTGPSCSLTRPLACSYWRNHAAQGKAQGELEKDPSPPGSGETGSGSGFGDQQGMQPPSSSIEEGGGISCVHSPRCPAVEWARTKPQGGGFSAAELLKNHSVGGIWLLASSCPLPPAALAVGECSGIRMNRNHSECMPKHASPGVWHGLAGRGGAPTATPDACIPGIVHCLVRCSGKLAHSRVEYWAAAIPLAWTCVLARRANRHSEVGRTERRFCTIPSHPRCRGHVFSSSVFASVEL